jgi:hypothetical protein
MPADIAELMSVLPGTGNGVTTGGVVMGGVVTGGVVTGGVVTGGVVVGGAAANCAYAAVGRLAMATIHPTMSAEPNLWVRLEAILIRCGASSRINAIPKNNAEKIGGNLLRGLSRVLAMRQSCRIMPRGRLQPVVVLLPQALRHPRVLTPPSARIAHLRSRNR